MANLQTQNETDERDLIQLLLKRQAELNSLLEVTQAINKNSPSSVLFEMLQVIFSVHLKIGKMRLLIKEEGHFYCATRFGGPAESPKVLQEMCHLLQELNVITPLRSYPHDLVSSYEYFVPVFLKEDSQAFVLIGNLNANSELISNDLSFIQTMINVIIVALENKKLFKERVERELLHRDIELASEVQNMLVPQKLPKSGTIEVGSTYLPNQNIGGDYFDFIPLSPTEYMWCIADVSGKGVSAALLMANLQASLRAWASVERDLSKIVERLNKIVVSNTNGERFITLFIGRYNEQDRQLEYVNAGHNPPIMLSGDSVKFLREGTTMIGAFDELPFIRMGKECLTPGTLIFNYTDGLVESAEEDVYISDEELVSHLLKFKGLPVDDLNKKILQNIKSLHKASMNSDDITLLSIRIL
ncbi:PP2C family protein-serine/threonine phosphatase [Daejeonella oryzae]|uniref:PP2C family protein-serine/threonine phosphatase n=1 Tax=Daejeonella oryzae TaxID=1122943 RepID=UPI00041CFB0C|nr:PP2C family protein-serine/threonine phosphatase [Daejeonella oryzae]